MKFKKLIFGILTISSLFIMTSCSQITDFFSGIGIKTQDTNNTVPTGKEVTGNDTTITNVITTIETIVEDKKYTVIWKNDDGKDLKTLSNVDGNSIPSYDGDTPTKEDDEKYSYTFSKFVEQSVDNTNMVITYVATYDRTYKIDTKITDWGYNDLQRYENKNSLILLYDEINSLCKDFYEAKIDATPTEINYSTGTEIEQIFSGEVEYSKYGLSTSEAKMVYACVVLDHPEYYFTKGLITGSNITRNSSTGEIISQTDYLCITSEEEYTSKTTRTTYLNQINNYKATVKELVKDETDNGYKVKYIHNYIINNARYAMKKDEEGHYLKFIVDNQDGTGHYEIVSSYKDASADDSSFSHNILGIVINKEGVCESYAKLFQLLLIDNGINCVRVSGRGYSENHWEAHAWNYAEVDGDWYAFDVTWDDPIVNGGTTDTIDYKYFGCGSLNSEFRNSHENHDEGDKTNGVNYLYVLPTLKATNLILIPRII